MVVFTDSWWQVLNVDHTVVSAIIAGVCCPTSVFVAPSPVTKCIMLVYQGGGAGCNDKIIGALITLWQAGHLMD